MVVGQEIPGVPPPSRVFFRFSWIGKVFFVDLLLPFDSGGVSDLSQKNDGHLKLKRDAIYCVIPGLVIRASGLCLPVVYEYACCMCRGAFPALAVRSSCPPARTLYMFFSKGDCALGWGGNELQRMRIPDHQTKCFLSFCFEGKFLFYVQSSGAQVKLASNHIQAKKV